MKSRHILKNRLFQGLFQALGTAGLVIVATSCAPKLTEKAESRQVPSAYNATSATDTTTSALVRWQEFFTDPYLKGLIDTALQNNQELNITRQEIEIARNEIRARKGEYLPFVGIGGRAELDKVGRYTVQGTTEENLDIKPGRTTPDPLSNFQLGAFANWEVDIWHRLRNARKAAVSRYLASVEGRNFMVTNLIAEIANSYFELLALDNQLAIVEQNIKIQSDALEIVRLQMAAAKVTELAVLRFEAQVQHTRSLQFNLQQQIIEAENHLNYLVGRYPQHIVRNDQSLTNMSLPKVVAGLPAQLLNNRPDIRQAEQNLAANRLDVQVARASFYPSLSFTAGFGIQAFTPALLTALPESLLYGIGGDLVAPLVNRNGLKANYYSANARQAQAVYKYEQTLRLAYLEVANQVANIGNLEKSYQAKTKEVDALNQSVTIANMLFKSARADYMEVLLTQREALESRFDLIENRLQQMNAAVNVYRSLGGGWR